MTAIEISRAYSETRKAIESGLIKKTRGCEICGKNKKMDVHHFDYGDPLLVSFLCRRCHLLIHKNKREKNGEIKKIFASARNRSMGKTISDIKISWEKYKLNDPVYIEKRRKKYSEGMRLIQGIVPTKFFDENVEGYIREYNRGTGGRMTVQRLIYVALKTYIDLENQKDGVK
jgi:hypothetical protein